MNRRDSLKIVLGAAAGAGLIGARAAFAQASMSEPAFKLPPLGYGYDALEPHIDTMTMTIHHQRHHNAFIGTLNQLAERWPELARWPAETVLGDLSKVPEPLRAPVRNNLGGHWNHTFFWELMTPGGAREPAGELKAAIEQSFGGTAQLVEKFNAAGLGRFGSGWAWLVLTRDRKLDVVNTPYQDTPHMDLGARPILGADVWEHAYYLKYQNRRGDYLKAWWNTINWDKATANFKKASA
jgi:Fe-Mn family superoxide dismutase